MISSLLTTNYANNLQSDFARAVAKKEPFDAKRLELFENLYLYLKKCNFRHRRYKFNTSSYRNVSFFESYFSNFIEGIEFLLDEAEDIVFKGTEINNRYADSHDVLTNYLLSNDFSEMNRTPKSATDLLNLLQKRHAYLMQERPDKTPGIFKEDSNKTGNTHFVLPDDVVVTLNQAFRFYELLSDDNDSLARALYIHFLISEVHPFNDGNGKLSRIMMSTELVKNGLFKVIIPAAHRENYLNGLRLASRDGNFYHYCKVLDQAQAYVETINWQDYDDSRETIENNCADKTSDEGLPFFNRVLRNLDLSVFVTSTPY